MSSFVKKQLIVFASLSAAAALIIVFGYVHIATVLGLGQSRMTAIFKDGGGVYVNSNVTTHGVVIGKVDSVSLDPDRRVKVDMYYDSQYHIPDDARAEIHSVSAVGEIYVEVMSDRSGGPFLASGAVIPLERTSEPEQIAPVLDKVTKLVHSIPNAGLQTFLDEGNKAFQNLGPDMQTLLESVDNLTMSADQHYEQTHKLIQSVGPLLDTQVGNGYGTNIKQYFADLAHFTGVVHDEDNYLRGAIKSVWPAAKQARNLLEANENTAPVLAKNLTTIGHLLGVYRDSIEQVLVEYPTLEAKEQRAFRGHGLTVTVVADIWNGCTRGFKGNELRNPEDLTDKDTPPNMFCKIPHDAQSFVRGARNIPCSEGYIGMRFATVDECFGRRPDQTPGSSGQAAYAGAPHVPTGPQGRPLNSPAPQRNYQHQVPASSEAMAPFGAKSTVASPGPAPWQSLLSGPLEN